MANWILQFSKRLLHLGHPSVGELYIGLAAKYCPTFAFSMAH
jgi:hypothetical protein